MRNVRFKIPDLLQRKLITIWTIMGCMTLWFHITRVSKPIYAVKQIGIIPVPFAFSHIEGFHFWGSDITLNLKTFTNKTHEIKFIDFYHKIKSPHHIRSHFYSAPSSYLITGTPGNLPRSLMNYGYCIDRTVKDMYDINEKINEIEVIFNYIKNDGSIEIIKRKHKCTYDNF